MSSNSLEFFHASYSPSHHTNFTKLKLIKFITASAIIMSKTYSLLNDTTFKYMPANLRHFTLIYSPFRETSIFFFLLL